MSREFTVEELATFDGTGDKPVYLAVKGQVFDMTSGKTFYGPGGPYEVFAGKEVARALAIMKIDASECNDNLADITEKQAQTLQGWIDKFTQKYPTVGRLVKGTPSAHGSQPSATQAAASKTANVAWSLPPVLIVGAVGAVAGATAALWWLN